MTERAINQPDQWILTFDDVRAQIDAERDPYSVREWCRQQGVNSSHAIEFMNGVRDPASDLLKALGMRWAIVWTEDGP